jgi:Protein kinase domain
MAGRAGPRRVARHVAAAARAAAALPSGRFEVHEQVGVGGMGQVFRARDLASGQTVAMKVLSDTREQRPERFARESALLAELVHPGIVRYIAHSATDTGELFLVMVAGSPDRVGLGARSKSCCPGIVRIPDRPGQICDRGARSLASFATSFGSMVR